MMPKTTTRRARWAAVTAIRATPVEGRHRWPPVALMVAPRDRSRPVSHAADGLSAVSQFVLENRRLDDFVPCWSTAGQALEQPDPIDTKRHSERRRDLRQP